MNIHEILPGNRLFVLLSRLGLRMNVSTTCYMTCYVFGVYHLIIEEGRISRLWKKNMVYHIFYLLQKSSKLFKFTTLSYCHNRISISYQS